MQGQQVAPDVAASDTALRGSTRLLTVRTQLLPPVLAVVLPALGYDRLTEAEGFVTVQFCGDDKALGR